MANESVLDELDYRLLRALQVAPRAGFARLAEVLGTSEATISRRYRRLRESGVMRVVGVLRNSALGMSEWLVRVQTRPDGTPAVAEALAAREDVSWVSINAAGSEVTCSLHSRSSQHREHLLVELLPRVATVLRLEASVVMHTFTTECRHEWPGIEQALTPSEVDALSDYSEQDAALNSIGRFSATDIRPADEIILRALAVDGRAANTELAAAAGISTSQAARRVKALHDSGAVQMHLEISGAVLGYTTRADLWLQVEPSSLRAVGAVIGAMPEVSFAAAVSGVHNLHASVYCASLEDLFSFVSDRIGNLKGVQRIDTSPVLRQLKQFNTLMKGERLIGTQHETVGMRIHSRRSASR